MTKGLETLRKPVWSPALHFTLHVSCVAAAASVTACAYHFSFSVCCFAVRAAILRIACSGTAAGRVCTFVVCHLILRFGVWCAYVNSGLAIKPLQATTMPLQIERMARGFAGGEWRSQACMAKRISRVNKACVLITNGLVYLSCDHNRL